jgi:RNA-directed DNA polymerase
VGKTHSGRVNHQRLGFKTIIKPSKEAEKRHTTELRAIIRKNRHAPQGQLIGALNPVIRGWTNYHKTVVAAETFHRCRKHLFQQLQEWGRRRHPNKGKIWIANKYWHVEDGHGWIFAEGKAKLWTHDLTHIQRHTKVKGTASPYDGNQLYWSKRLRNHPLLSATKGKLLQKQAGKCRWCGLLFQDGDLIEIDHITPKKEGGGEALSNKCALHRHCHDERHAKRVAGTYGKGQVIEEPDALKDARPVLKTSRRGDSLA